MSEPWLPDAWLPDSPRYEPAAGLFTAAGPPAVVAATSDPAWLVAMLDVERAIAIAAARLGLVDPGAAHAVVQACDPAMHDVHALAESSATDATPVIALVRRLRELVPESARPAVHLAATSQDVVDTAAMLVLRRALGPVLEDAAAVADELGRLAARYRSTHQIGRTLLQHGRATTFGAACAGRLVAVEDAIAAVMVVLAHRLAVQLGGAVGTLAPAGGAGALLVAEVARELGLHEPVVPWHTSRGRVAEVATAAGVLAGELAAVALDVVLLCSSDVRELGVGAPGSSSAIPHKRNPAHAVLAVSCAHRVPALVGTILAGMPQELQRSAGRWQAEPATLSELLRLVGGVAEHTLATLQGLIVHADVMAATVERLLACTGGTSDDGSACVFVDRALAAHATARALRTAPA